MESYTEPEVQFKILKPILEIRENSVSSAAVLPDAVSTYVY
jgi:hypothetical protein